jgi:hypothetical protein
MILGTLQYGCKHKGENCVVNRVFGGRGHLDNMGNGGNLWDTGNDIVMTRWRGRGPVCVLVGWWDGWNGRTVGGRDSVLVWWGRRE